MRIQLSHLILRGTVLVLLISFTQHSYVFAQSLCNVLEVLEVGDDTSPTNINPSLSCDGQQLVWRGNDGTSNLIYRATCNEAPVLVSDLTVINTRPQISADGSTIVWSGFTIDEDFNLVSQNIYKSVNGGPQELVSPQTANSIAESNESPQVCADGSVIIWTGLENDVRHIFKNDGTNTIRLSTNQSSQNSIPQISNDCQVITWTGFDEQNQIYQIYRYENGVLSIIAASGGSSVSFNQVLSADGNVIAWIGLDGAGLSQLFIHSNGVIQQITANMPGSHMRPSISLDGSIITWTNFDPATQLSNVYLYSNGTISLIDSYQLSSSDPVFLTSSVSATGNRITWEDPNGNIHLIDLPSGQTEIVASNIDLFQQELRISCNGEVIVFPSFVGELATDVFRGICTNDFCIPVNVAADNAADEAADDATDDSVAVTPIPTMGEWGLICLSILFLIVGIQRIKEENPGWVVS